MRKSRSARSSVCPHNIHQQKLNVICKKGIIVTNRIAMAPMTTWANNDDYTISADEVKHYAARVKGIGLVITGCTRVTPNGIGFTHD
jgi:2,4-dienoyl-CoA reductase-like NADH-dependent reductase (Old Yellow Enzyme family)